MAHTHEQKRAHANAKRSKLRLEINNYLGGACKVCGSTESLQIDHVDPKTKVMNVSQMLTCSENRLWKEVDKCQLLCENCHKEKTAVDRKYANEWHTFECACGVTFKRQKRQLNTPAKNRYCSPECKHVYSHKM